MAALKTVSVDELAAEKLPAEIVDAIDNVLDDADFGIYIGVKKGSIVAGMHLRASIRKTLILVGLMVFLWQVAPDAYAYLPLLLGLLHKSG